MVSLLACEDGEIEVIFFARYGARVDGTVGAIGIICLVEIDFVHVTRIKLLVFHFHVPADRVGFFAGGGIGKPHSEIIGIRGVAFVGWRKLVRVEAVFFAGILYNKIAVLALMSFFALGSEDTDRFRIGVTIKLGLEIEVEIRWIPIDAVIMRRGIVREGGFGVISEERIDFDAVRGNFAQNANAVLRCKTRRILRMAAGWDKNEENGNQYDN